MNAASKGLISVDIDSGAEWNEVGEPGGAAKGLDPGGVEKGLDPGGVEKGLVNESSSER